MSDSKECCCLDCPPNSTAKLVPNPDGPGPDVCKCVCDSYPPECNDKEYLKTDPWGNLRYEIYEDNTLPCYKNDKFNSEIKKVIQNFTGPPCSCLCKDVIVNDRCAGLSGKSVTVTNRDIPSNLFPYTGNLDPRDCSCEKICTEQCDSSNLTQDQIDIIRRDKQNPYSDAELIEFEDALSRGNELNLCTVPGMCCVTGLNPDDPYISECSNFCDPEGKRQCCALPLNEYRGKEIATLRAGLEFDKAKIIFLLPENALIPSADGDEFIPPRLNQIWLIVETIPDGRKIEYRFPNFKGWENRKPQKVGRHYAEVGDIIIRRQKVIGLDNLLEEYGFLTFCCEECEECQMGPQGGSCVPIPGCVKSEPSPPSPQSINIESL